MKRSTKDEETRGIIANRLQWLRMEPRALLCVEQLVEQFPFRMFEVVGRKLMLLVDHHKHARFQDSKRLLICTLKMSTAAHAKNRFYYITALQ